MRLLTMIAVGQAIGTGLFLGSSIGVRMAGPGVVLSYAVGAVITLAVMRALSGMTVAHPMAGSFGAYAEHYLGPWAGWVTRYTYAAAMSVAMGGHILAVAIYCRYWFPSAPAWVWIAGFSAALLAVNTLDVGKFGEFEFWFALIKVGAILLFVLFGIAYAAGLAGPRPSLEDLSRQGGLLPRGWSGVWGAVTMAIFSYYGLEVASVSSGEARDPARNVPRAMRRTLVGLAFCYIASSSILVGLLGRNEVEIGESPFVRLYTLMRVPAAPALMNAVVITAALSSCNASIYVVARFLFSLARSGQAPRALGKLNRRGVPARGVLTAGAGLAAAVLLERALGDEAFVTMAAGALFGGIFCWLVVLATHVAFRRARGRAFPWSSAAGFAALLALLVTMAFLEEMRAAWIAGPPWLAGLSLAYLAHRRRPRSPASFVAGSMTNDK